jgi:tyrosyl-tRNA synthetase
MAGLELVPSATEAERVIKQGGFEVDGQIVKDPAARINLRQPASYQIRLGKRTFVRLVVEVPS